MSCKCQNCGIEYNIDLIISDELWEQIKPENKPNGAGLLCANCILEKIANIYKYSAYDLIDVNKIMPR